MAEASEAAPNLPNVLLLKPLAFPHVEAECSRNFLLLKAYDSPQPIHLFLSTHATSVSALLCSAGTPVTTETLRLLPCLRLIVTTSVGLDELDLSECRRRGIAVSNPGAIFADDVADLAVGLLIDVVRKISAADRYVRRGLWRVEGDHPLGNRLGDMKVGIVGLGNIGFKVAKRLEGLGCRILYNSRKKKSFVSYPYHSNICDLASRSDVLVICCALTDQTRRMINDRVLSLLGKDGVIVNVGRGAIVDEEELVRFLLEGEIAGAGLDVFENEPYVPKELFELDNIVLSPHRAVFTPEALQDLEELVVGNLKAFFSSQPLLSQVVFE
ncbi:hypothetical protein Nepgr_024342 [Nepenthes gracilis]|uniref:Glyoxylate/hydroxypyruvate reductase HPR3 n=1 Tax=Nepenthes gracilis TaxID=150966 RepID=A0AAD3XZY1_NEPGR|nr:hypothetical protein Nepgr_024342 [Nepenthes gracilis]